MSQTFNVYCDESSHLENDGHSVMVLGAVWCSAEKVREISIRLREIKERNGLKPFAEIKWTKVSPAKQQFYFEILDYFFDDDDLHFTALVIPDKSKLRHSDFSQTHDDWYYKMYFSMLKVILEPNSVYRIYLDIKDTRSENKIRKLHEFLCNHVQDSERQIVQKLQSVRSHEVAILQITDLLIGAVNYANRNLHTSEAKLKFVQRLRERSRYDLTRSTLPLESKVNISIWKAQEETE
jgi:hypothetical protein